MTRIILTCLLGLGLSAMARPAAAEAIPMPRWYWRDACGSCPALCNDYVYDCPCFRYTYKDMNP